MGTYATEKIRNLGIVAHGGAGKTSLAEAILFNTGMIDRLGRVDDGTSTMDFEPEETKRKISISSAFDHCEWDGHSIHFVDTPGYGDFIGDTLCDPHNPIVFVPAQQLLPDISYAIEPTPKADEDKIPTALHRMIEEEPTLESHRDTQTKEFIISGLGQVHLDVIVEKMKRKFNVEVLLKTPKVPYLETIRGTVKVQGKYKKQSGGRGQYGDCWIELAPTARGEGYVFEDKIVGGVVPRQYIPAVDKGIQEAAAEGFMAGYPVVDFRVSLYDGSFHTVDSSEMAFKVAGSMAFKKGMEQCKPTLLEPIVTLTVIVPDETMGDVIGDLNSRRGKIVGVEPKANSQVIRAVVPMSEVLAYSNDLKSMTSDRGLFSTEFSHYEDVPTHLAAKVVAESQAEK